MIMSAKHEIVLQGSTTGGFSILCVPIGIRDRVAGSVMNLTDGSVYIEVEGDSHLVDVFVDHCRKGLLDPRLPFQ